AAGGPNTTCNWPSTSTPSARAIRIAPSRADSGTPFDCLIFARSDVIFAIHSCGPVWNRPRNGVVHFVPDVSELRECRDLPRQIVADAPAPRERRPVAAGAGGRAAGARRTALRRV